MVKDRLEVNVKPSLRMCALLVASHCLAISGILVSMLEVHYKAVFISAVTVSLIANIHRFGLLLDPLSVMSVFYRDEAWFLSCRNGQDVCVLLDPPVFVASFLVVLNFKDARGRSFPVAIFSDAVHGTQMRHCRIFLKFHPNLGGTRMVSLGSSNKSG